MHQNSSGHESSLHGCNGEVSSLAGDIESFAYSIFLISQLLLSIFGNMLVCLAIIRFSHLRTLTNTFIFSLAVTDLLTPFVRVLFIAVSMFRLKWAFGCFWCQLSSVLGVFLCASSIMHLCAISVERLIVIRWPLQQPYFITKSRVTFVLVNIWITALLLSLFPYFGIVRLTFNAQLLDCEISWDENPKMAVMLACFFFLMPFFLMTVTYYYIFQEVKTQTRKITSLTITESPDREKDRKASVSSRLRISRILRQELKAVKIIVVVIGLFFALWLPFFAVTSVRAYTPEAVSGDVQRFVFALAYSNSSCNWIVYSIMNKELRTVFKRMLSPLIACVLSRRQQSLSQVGYDLPNVPTRSVVSMESKASTSDSLWSFRNGSVAKRAKKSRTVNNNLHAPIARKAVSMTLPPTDAMHLERRSKSESKVKELKLSQRPCGSAMNEKR